MPDARAPGHDGGAVSRNAAIGDRLVAICASHPAGRDRRVCALQRAVDPSGTGHLAARLAEELGTSTSFALGVMVGWDREAGIGEAAVWAVIDPGPDEVEETCRRRGWSHS